MFNFGDNSIDKSSVALNICWMAISFGALVWLGRENYLTFHCLAELFSIIVAVAIFVIVWNVRQTLDNGYLRFLGVALLFVAAIDLAHMLAYKGMGVFQGYGVDLPTQLWIAGRGLQALSLLVAPFFLSRRFRPHAMLAIFAAITLLVLFSTFRWRIFPACYIEGHGLTQFKISAEYVICLILIFALAGLLANRSRFQSSILLLLCGSILTTIFSEFAFTKYANVYGDFNLIGHLLKIISVIFIYKALVETGLRQPYELLYRNLAESERKFRSAIESNMIGVVFADLITGTVTEANDEYLRIIGRTRSELKAGKINWKAITPAGILAREESAIREQVDNKATVLSFEKEYIRPDGSRVPVILGGAFLDNGQRRMVAYVLDNTARRKAEEQLQKAHDELEQKILERTQELQKARQIAETRAGQLQALAAELVHAEQKEKRQLAKILHDHLQQLLVAAKMNTSVIRAKTEDKDIHEIADSLTKMLNEAIQASRTLTADLSPPILHEKGLAAGLGWLQRQMREKHGLTLRVTADAAAEPVSEQVRIFLFEAVRELLLNAIKHARVERAQVRMQLIESGEIELVVEDNGIGFDPAQVENIQSTTGGFGLFSIRERLNYLGGRMHIDAAPGQGSRFTLIAPARLAPEPASPAAKETKTAAEPPSSGPKIRVLIADDHTVVRHGLTKLLEEQSDIQVIGEAAKGYEAVEMAKQLNPDVILMDIGLPDISGLDATRLILSSCPESYVIGLSMHEEDDMAASMIHAGAAAYLTKGGPTQPLISAIRASRSRMAMSNKK